LLVVRGLEGITLSGLPAIAMTYLSEEIESRSLGFAMGLYVSGTAFGGMTGRLLTAVISDLSTWRMAVFSMGGLGLVASIIFWYALPASKHFVPQPLRIGSFFRSATHQFSDRVLPWLFLMGFLLMGAFVTVYNYIGYRLMAPPYHFSQTFVGLLFSTYLVGIFSSTWAGRLADKFGKASVLWTMVITMFAGVLFTLAESLVWVVLGVTVCTFGFFGGHSIASSWVAERAKPSRAQASSLYLFAYYEGSSLIGSLTGFAWGQGGWFAVVTVLALLLATALAVAIGLRKFVPTVASDLDFRN
jgi:MFS transporter, YNFM family, putative membrane transport protein